MVDTPGIWIAPEILALPGLTLRERLLCAFVDTVERRRGACTLNDLLLIPELIARGAAVLALLDALAVSGLAERYNEESEFLSEWCWRLRFQTSGPEGLG